VNGGELILQNDRFQSRFRLGGTYLTQAICRHQSDYGLLAMIVQQSY
jgi:hypothetical protein